MGLTIRNAEVERIAHRQRPELLLESLLYKGDDFSKTDLPPLTPPAS